ncbi:MAG: transglycosylase SLT domain-containing protein [Burkholderiales bacterium]
MGLFRLFLACLFLGCARGAAAAGVELPLRVPLAAVEQALGARLAASPAGPNVVYREGRCRYLRLETPRLEAVEGRVRLSAPGSAALGLEVLGNCQNAAAWRGMLHVTLAPQLDAAGRLRLRVIDSRLADAGQDAAGLAFLWDLSKRHLHARLEEFSLDVAPLRDALLQVVGTAAPPAERAALETALVQLRFLAPRVEPGAVTLPIALEVPDAWLVLPPPASAAPLSAAQLEALDRALQPWDAFLVHSIRQFALDRDDAVLRQRLFTLLLDSRYQLSAILSGEAIAAGDPLRALFMDAWNELRAILAADATLRYAAFLDAGDALLALDSAAPGLGMRVSADGLRQLARALNPTAAGDPLAYDWTVDRQLRTVFGVEEIPDTAPPTPRGWLDFFIRRAHAERPLDRWAPTRAELDLYEARIGELLRVTAAGQLKRASLPAPYDTIYERLVPTTALIESCWRQYAVRGGKPTYVRSGSGSVGIMQINQRVWRGFYDVERLRWNTAYNVRAGAQILMRYLKDYAIPYAKKTGDTDDVPRAAYAVYNAGPRAVGRFDKSPPHPREARVDQRLWNLYQGIASGEQVDLRSCDLSTASAS